MGGLWYNANRFDLAAKGDNTVETIWLVFWAVLAINAFIAVVAVLIAYARGWKSKPDAGSAVAYLVLGVIAATVIVLATYA